VWRYYDVIGHQGDDWDERTGLPFELLLFADWPGEVGQFHLPVREPLQLMSYSPNCEQIKQLFHVAKDLAQSGFGGLQPPRPFLMNIIRTAIWHCSVTSSWVPLQSAAPKPQNVCTLYSTCRVLKSMLAALMTWQRIRWDPHHFAERAKSESDHKRT
jgi:hypothetical protein